MTLSGYASSGGVRGAIAETAETVFTDQFTHEQQDLARRIFLRLTELGDETSTGDTRRRATFEELILRPEDAESTRAVLKALADARLITTSEDTAEVAHEALIREWPTLRGWLEDNREGLRLHRHLTETAQEWDKLDREPDMLYRGARLTQAHEWAITHEHEINRLEREFLAASIESREREASEREAQRQRDLVAAQTLAEAQRKRAEAEEQRAVEHARAAGQLSKRARYLTGAFILASIMVFAALFFGSKARQSAVDAQAASNIAGSRELAAAAISNLPVDPERSILLALQAVSKTYTTEAENALHRSLLASHVRLSIPAHTDTIWSIAYSPDGTRFATASQDGTAKVWEASSGKEIFTFNVLADGGVNWLVFSNDGKRIASASGDGQAQVWDATTGRKLLTLSGHRDAVLSIAYSPDGKRLATASLDKTAKVWDAMTGKQLLSLPGYSDCVTGIAFSPDGLRVATASCDNTVKVWDSGTGQELMTLLPPSPKGSFISTIAFSPDGMWLASGNNILNVSNGQPLLTLIGHTNNMHVIAFSADGKHLATTSRDRSAIVWDAVTGDKLLQLWGHSSPVFGVAFSPDGKHLATGDESGILRIWDIGPDQEFLALPPPVEAHAQEGFRSVIFNPDGSLLFAAYNLSGVNDSLQNMIGLVKVLDPTTGEELSAFSGMSGIIDMAVNANGTRLALAHNDTTATLLNPLSGQETSTLSGHNDLIFDIAFSPDGSRVATASWDGTARLWDATTGKELFALPEGSHEVPLEGVAFSPDGTRLAISGWGGVAEVLDLSSGKIILNLAGHTDTIYEIAFSPDGTRLATASRDGTAKLWDAVTGNELFTLNGHTSTIYGLAFSADGTRLATGSTDATVKLWNVATGQELLTLPGNIMVAFSPDGTRLVTGSRDDKTLLMYVLQIDDLIALAKSRLTRSLTTEECQQYLHVDTCPPEP
jgi:WD40 repeat protein